MSSQYFPPYVVSRNNIKVVLDLSSYLRKDDLVYFKGKNLSEKNYLVYVPMNRYLNKISNTKNISSWRSMGISDDELKSLNNTTLVPQLLHPYYHSGVQA